MSSQGKPWYRFLLVAVVVAALAVSCSRTSKQSGYKPSSRFIDPIEACVQPCVAKVAQDPAYAAFQFQEPLDAQNDLGAHIKNQGWMTCDEAIKSVGQESAEMISRAGIERIRVYQKACSACLMGSASRREGDTVTDHYRQMRALGAADWGYTTADPDYTPEMAQRAHSPTANRASVLSEVLRRYDHTVAAAQYVSMAKKLIVLLYSGQRIPGSLACLLEREWEDLEIEIRRTCHPRAVYERVRWVLENGEWLDEHKEGQLLIGEDPFGQGVFDIEMYKGNAPAVPVLKRELGCLFDELVEVNLRSSPRWLGH